jgi:hypothetical protein
MSGQNIEIKGSKRVKNTQISNGDGSQNLKVVDSEDVESEQIIGKGEKRDKTPDSRTSL